MIKFFRHICKTLFSENKFSKYLLYATGELILVFIDVATALLFNNWKEALKTREKEQGISNHLRLS